MKVLFETRTGSRAYGLQMENSDCDTLRVVAHGPDEYLGITPYKESAQFKNGKDDVTVYDIRFFGKLLCAGNPNAILTLYFDRSNYMVLTPEFEKFLLHRRDYLGPRVIESFRGFAYRGEQEFYEMMAGQVEGLGVWKRAATSLYVLTALKSLGLSGGLGFRDGEIEFIRQVKRGNVDAEEVKSVFERLNKTTTKEVIGFYRVLSTQEAVNEAVNREVRNLLVKCLNT